MKANAGNEGKFLDLNACLFTYLFTFAFNSGKIFSSSSLSCQTTFFIAAGAGLQNWPVMISALSWVPLGPPGDAGRRPRRVLLGRSTHPHPLRPPFATSSFLPSPWDTGAVFWSTAHPLQHCQGSWCLPKWKGHALPPRLLGLPWLYPVCELLTLIAPSPSPAPLPLPAPGLSRVSWNPAARGLLVDWYKQS